MKKFPYFPVDDGLARRAPQLEDQLRIIARRYVGDHAPTSFVCRAMPQAFFRRQHGAYRIDLAEKLGAGNDGYALVSGLLSVPVDKEVWVTAACLGPCRIWLNGEEIFSSTFEDEIHKEQPHTLRVTLKAGQNVLLLLCRRTAAGFGCLLGLPPVTVCNPLPGAEGAAGWVWTELLDSADARRVTGCLNNALAWKWHTESAREPEGVCVRWTRAQGVEGMPVTLTLTCRLPSDCYINGEQVLKQAEGTQTIRVPFHAPMDIHVLGNGTVCADVPLVLPFPVQGRREAWLCAPAAPDAPFDYARYTSLTEAPWQDIRLFYEGAFSDIWWVKTGNSAYGSWNYPMGVTLQGLLRMADVTASPDICDYVLGHMRQCLDHYAYACRDAETYGATDLNPELVSHSNLDQFGSMGAAMLECAKRMEHPQFDRLSAEFFAFIRDQLPKLEDGTFCRRGHGPYDVDTIWADDLYMGTSFLTRYWQRYGDELALDMAANQFLLYAKRLLQPENVFSHVYDLTRGMKTGIPWGRGNGWALFSLSELMEAMPQTHALWPRLHVLFCRLSAGYAALQDARGYWHQVLTDPESYEETSCTAMFTYAMSKGLRHGWYEDTETYLSCVLKGWQAISSFSVDKDGNVHAVCKGSGFSFTREYYAEDLFWITNDNHGVGIVLLAGSEVLKLLNGLDENESTVFQHL